MVKVMPHRVETRGNDASDIGRSGVDDIERDRRSKVNHHNAFVAPRLCHRRGVGEAVGTNAGRIREINLNPEPGFVIHSH